MRPGTVLAIAAAGPVFGCAVYLGALSVLAARQAPPKPGPGTRRFDIVVPAHNEEAGVGATVASLRAIDYPAELVRILVVADNCTDRTAERAEAAGATVLVRRDAERRGKGYALAHAFEQSARDGFADVVVVIDADTTVSSNLLRAFDARFEAGAQVAQAEYGVRNPEASWRTRLMTIALSLFHTLRSLGRERLELSAGLRGNGMAFTSRVLQEVPHEAFSIVEDVEYGVRLGLAGHRVHYAAEAEVLGDMGVSETAAQTQRLRWEGGRFALARAHAARLIREGVARRDPVLLDLAMDLLVPPLSTLTAACVAGTIATGAAAALRRASPLAVVPWVVSSGCVLFYVARGVTLSSVGPRGFLDLAWAPVYMVWKAAIAFRKPAHARGEWVRTEREGEQEVG